MSTFRVVYAWLTNKITSADKTGHTLTVTTTWLSTRMILTQKSMTQNIPYNYCGKPYTNSNTYCQNRTCSTYLNLMKHVYYAHEQGIVDNNVNAIEGNSHSSPVQFDGIIASEWRHSSLLWVPVYLFLSIFDITKLFVISIIRFFK